MTRIHEMRLQPSSFERIKNKSKTIEIRLNDEKRQRVQVGDEIVFSLMGDAAQKIRTEVLELLSFPTFQELFAVLLFRQYEGINKDGYMSMYKRYSREEEKKHGALGIRLRYLGER